MQYLEPEQKALEINLDDSIYGSFAEIGAGQEVARFFFKVGAAAGTIAKSISAYDKIVSDHVYGAETGGRYVCESRLYKMLDHEYELMIDRLSSERINTRFFAFADTVSTINFHKTTKGHGWIGMRFQLETGGEANDIVLHVEMLDGDASLQQQALGILGVNLIYGCFRYYSDYKQMIGSLLDNLRDRAKIDMMRLTGPQFEKVDNRLLALELVKQGHTQVAIFDKKARPVQASEFLYKQNVLVVRGSFRPITHVNIDMLHTATQQFKATLGNESSRTQVFSEITLSSLCLDSGAVDEKDYLDRCDLLNFMGQNVMITDCKQYTHLISYLVGYRIAQLALVVGARPLLDLLNEKFYQNQHGLLLGAFAEIFTQNVRLYVYPAQKEGSGELLTSQNLPIAAGMNFLYQHILQQKHIVDIENFDAEQLHIYSPEVLRLLKNDESNWEKFVPHKVAQYIKEHFLFGFPCQQAEFNY